MVFILRDHVNMFTDLGKDWVSGPPTDYYRFIPMIYGFELDMHHFQLNLYVNDQNIIDKPLVRDENGALMSSTFESSNPLTYFLHSNVDDPRPAIS